MLRVGGSLLAVLALIALSSALYTLVKETEQVIITQFGKPVGEPITDAGLQFKMPFIQKVNRIDKRILEWDGAAQRDADARQALHLRRHLRALAHHATRSSTSAACATSAAPSRASTTSSAARRATRSPSTT